MSEPAMSAMGVTSGEAVSAQVSTGSAAPAATREVPVIPVTTAWLADPAVRAAHAALSPASLAWLDHAAAHPECLERAHFAGLAQPSAFSPYPLQPWPVFVDAARVAEMERVATGLCRLVKAIPRRLFDGDPVRIDAFYGLGGAERARALLGPPDGIDAALGRGDFLLADGGFRCLELNLASHLGGWQAPLWAPAYLEVPAVRRFLTDHRLRAACRDTVAALFSHVLATARRRAPRGPIDISFAAPAGLDAAMSRQFAAYLESRFRAVREREAPGVAGSVVLCPYGELRERGGQLFHRQGARPVQALQALQAVVEVHDGATSADAFRCFKAGNLDLYNAPVRAILADKRNLALLSEEAGSGRFSAEERALIERAVPWTRRLAAAATTWRGERTWLPELARRERERLVIKPAAAGQGRGVYLGAETPAARWDELLAAALAGEGQRTQAAAWVVQERVEPLPLLGQHGERGCAPHEVVWGLFDFGGRYAGGFLSLRPQGEAGVVNVHQGASEGIILEVTEGLHPGEVAR